VANNLYFDIIANQAQASAALVKLSESIEAVSARLDRLDGRNVDVDVNVKTDESRRALDSFTSRFQLMVGGIVAASPLAGAAIIGGIGAGFIGVAALAQKSNEQVKQTYATLWQNVVQETRQATNQLVPQLVGAGRAIDAEFQRLAPTMQSAFSAAGPDLVALTRGVTGFSQGAMPGLTSAMQNSLPVFQGIASAATILGAAVGAAFTAIGQHSQAYGTFMASIGNITSTVLGLAVHLVNQLAEVWATNGAQISQAIAGVATVIAGLADGVLPTLSAALGAAAKIITTVTDVLGPLAPVLGTVGAAALALWAAFRLAEGAQAAVKLLAAGVLSMGASLETGAARTAGMIAGLRGVTTEASASAVAVRAAGASAATASVGFAATAEALAGPLSIALVAGIALFTAFSGGEEDAGASAANLKSSLDGVTSALEASNGAIDQSVLKALQSSEAFKTAVDQASRFGISQSDVMAAVLQGGPAVDKLREKLQHLVDTEHKYVTVAGGSRVDQGLNAAGEAAKKTLDALNDLIGGFGKSRDSAASNNAEIQKHAVMLLESRDGMIAVSETSQTLGIDLDQVKAGFMGVALAGGSSASSVEAVAGAYLKSALQVANAAAAIQDRFKQADAAVESASASVENAQHSYEQSTRAIADAHHQEEAAARGVQQAEQGLADAQHGVVTAQRAVRDAIEGVTNARKAYIQAQEQEQAAERSLSEARQQAVRDLKAINLQLEEQNASEASARVRLFDAQESAKALGINAQNASKIAGQKVTATNEEQIKAAIDLLQAQNALNNALNTGANLREDAAKANAEGINGARGVVSAQQSLRSAQDQVASSARAVQRAQEQVTDANYGLQQAQRGLVRAHQAVSDAAYAEQKAHQAVTDAEYQSKRAADALKKSKDALKDAQDGASRSLDLNTDAGRRNLGLVLQLVDAINATGLSTQDKYKAAIDRVAGAFGMSKDRAADYLKQLGLIPQDFKFSVTAVAALDSVGLWDAIPSPSGHGNASMTGKSRMFAGGGHIRGPGTPTSDDIPIWASDNEYMHRAAAVSYYGVDTMDAINNLRVPKSLFKGYASGGLVNYKMIEANALLGSLGAAYQSSTNSAIVLGLPHGPLLSQYAPPAFGGGGDIPNFAPGSGVARWSNAALAAMAELGIPASYLPAVLRRMNQESGGNPTIVNKWDSNWTRGTPSVGLMQVIGPTFRSNAGPHVGTGPFSYGVSVDPVSNIYAGLNYAGRRYGSGHGGYLGGVLYAMNKPGGYDNGGPLQPGWTPVFNGTGRPENVRTADAEDRIVETLKGMKGGNTYILNVYNAENSEISLRSQFKRLEMEAGLR
jgi:SLT domain-containing protein